MISRRLVAIVALACTVGIVASRWPFHSHALFSWDSANFALALARIDIAAHRPHPPGYLGYVFAGRALDALVHDPNLALVLWNVLVTAVAAFVMFLFAWESSSTRRLAHGVTAALVLATSPLLWLYGEVAEIYPSEMLVTLLVAYAAWRALQERGASMGWGVAALGAAALFKASAAFLMLPLAASAWWRMPSTSRRKVALACVATMGAVAALFFVIQPDIVRVVWAQFTGSTVATRLVGTDVAPPLRTLNRNARDTLLSAASALGIVNVIALVVWALVDRRLPHRIGRGVALAWLLPWVLVFVFIHIGKPGYVLPLLPLGALVVAGFYVRQSLALRIALVAGQAVLNTLHFVDVTPLSEATLGGSRLYWDKSFSQRTATDLQPLTFPTVSTIQESDRRVAQMLALVRDRCPGGDPIVFAEADWRRTMWYLPSASAIYVEGGRYIYLGRRTDFSPIPDDGVRLRDHVSNLLADVGRRDRGSSVSRRATRARTRRGMAGAGGRNRGQARRRRAVRPGARATSRAPASETGSAPSHPRT